MNQYIGQKALIEVPMDQDFVPPVGLQSSPVLQASSRHRENGTPRKDEGLYRRRSMANAS